jgi:hypothetical protein
MHPLSGSFAELKDSEVESKITQLTNIYFMAGDPGMKAQVASLLEDYNQEIGRRRNEQMQKMMAGRDKSIDKLVKVN